MKAILAQRARLLAQARTSPELQWLLLAQCQRDILFWFRYFCWTFDPRQPQPHLPFIPYPFQEEVLLEIQSTITEGRDLLVEKSRDMGLSWLVLLSFQYYWLFKPGANFHLGSRKQESVDRKGDISTLFEKLRYNLDWLPAWMKPEGFQGSQHDNLLRLINPDNGNVITGESSNENFGRGGRYRAVLFDEFPFWPMQDAAFASAGQSTPCRIIVGTPYGKSNRFADLRFSGQTQVLSVHWSRHPHKDTTWYEDQKRRMSEDELARELDINYHLSRQDRVFRNFTEANRGDLESLEGKRIIRSWDFGYHCPACLFIQLDDDDCLRVLHEEVGNADLLIDFARRVQEVSRLRYPEMVFEDICDPAGAQRSDKSAQTSIEILNSLGIYPHYDRSRIQDGLELMRMKLSERIPDVPGGKPGLVVDRRCVRLIEAFEGGYRYGANGSEAPIQEHPYEDVMDCLRYAVMYKCAVRLKSPKKSRSYRPQNRYTGY
jgi:hypothetical protein